MNYKYKRDDVIETLKKITKDSERKLEAIRKELKKPKRYWCMFSADRPRPDLLAEEHILDESVFIHKYIIELLEEKGERNEK